MPVRALHLTDVQQLAKEKPVDIAFVCMKSYDTAWATMMIRQYLAPDGFVVSLQNCMNEETIAGVVGWGKTLGCIASSITVNLPAPGHIHRGAGKGGKAHTVFRAGEVHGRITPRAEEVCRLVGTADSAKVTDNLWGERWSKLVANVMGNGLSACTGLSGGRDAAERRRCAASRPGSAARRSASARRSATSSRRSCTCRPRPSPGPARATRRRRRPTTSSASRTAARPRPSSAPRWARTCRKAAAPRSSSSTATSCARARRSASPARANAVLTDIVKRVEKGELKPDPRHIAELRLN